jgi:hypothetical protein
VYNFALESCRLRETCFTSQFAIIGTLAGRVVVLNQLNSVVRDIIEAGLYQEEMGRIADFGGFRVILESALAYSAVSKGSWSPYDCVAIFQILILATHAKLP